jgi:predicted kinase
MRRPLILTGGPAVGKSSTARQLALSRPRAALVDVDDLRHLVVSGHAAPWEGTEGRRQQHLGVKNACALTQHFSEDGFEVVITDVITDDTIKLYRHLLPAAVVVHLQAPLPELRRRAAARAMHITSEEFENLHRTDRQTPPKTDHHLDVAAMTLDDQVLAVERLWSRA